MAKVVDSHTVELAGLLGGIHNRFHVDILHRVVENLLRASLDGTSGPSNPSNKGDEE